MHILPNISRTKGNHETMKFHQLIQHNIRNTFLEKSYKTCDREPNPRPFSEKSTLSKSLNQQTEHFIPLAFIVCTSSLYVYQNLLKLRYCPLAFTFCKSFLKNKKRSGTSLPSSFSAWLLKKNISRVVLLTDQISMPDCLYFLRYWLTCVIIC